ncbi:AMP-binding protein [Bacillus sp. FJAT-29814]|uniref:AMP-binding protein n=1 Tax=Bacillus sp. FJAT-29814 TaxID=1729688 RepID=UPI0008356A7A|nr:AMP-binding protein [Bacillus sp. FJAT-29814]
MYKGIWTFGKVVEFRTKTSPFKRFVRFEHTDVTYNEFHKNGNKVADFMKSLGLSKGQTCAVMLPNCPEFLFTWLGLSRIGVIEVPINTSFRGDLLTYMLNKAECQAIVISADLVDRVEAVIGELENLRHIIIVGGFSKSSVDSVSVHSFEELLSQASDSEIDVEITPDDPSVILFTSGTTGPSKGVVLTHIHNFKLAENCCEIMDYGPEDRLFTGYPLFHGNARFTTVLAALLADSDVVLHEKFSTSKFWDICRAEKITSFNALGSLFTLLMKLPERPDDADHLVRKAYGGPTPPELYDAFRERFNVKVTEIYGLTEVGTVTNNLADSFRKGSCGRAVPFYEIEIHDEDDRPCPQGVAGEIVLRPKEPGVMFTGYYKMEKETVEAWKNLWFHSGDRGMKDEDGYIYFIDRKKDAIRRRGENISSYEVERVINSHPSVYDSAAVGVPAENNGDEEVLAVIMVKDGATLEPEELLEFCKPRMAHFAIPRYIRLVKELPRNTSQRVEKYKLRQEGITLDTWDRERAGYEVQS